MQFLQDGYNSHQIETLSNNKIKKRIWIDEIGNVMSSRGIHFQNNNFDESIISKNKIIMSYAVDYAKEKNFKKEILAPINYARIRKKIYLPSRLIDLNRAYKIKVFQIFREKSSIKWKFKFEKVPFCLRKQKYSE